MNLEEITGKLRDNYKFNSSTFEFLNDKGFEEKEYIQMLKIMEKVPKISCKKHKHNKTDIEQLLEDLTAREFTDGRYRELVDNFDDISSEYALMRERLHVQVEYIIGLSEFMSTLPKKLRPKLFNQTFDDNAKEILRDIYRNFTMQDAAAIKLIDKKTRHDVVAANTWLAIKAQTAGLDGTYLRAITHFARTSADINTNAIAVLYTNAMNEWMGSLKELMSTIQTIATDNMHTTMLAQTHGQYAQFTTLGYELECILHSMSEHGKDFFSKDKFLLEGKMDGAIGTDVDMVAALGNDVDIRPVYKKLIEGLGLKYSGIGSNQDISNVAFVRMFDGMDNVGIVVQKLANDWWHYASRALLQKKTERGNSGSSAMPQKLNPFDAESAEVLQSIFSGYLTPLKQALIAYRTQGDLRRSMAMREAFHPIMLSIIAMKRLSGELKRYTPNLLGMEVEIYRDNNGVKAASSAIQNRLRALGVEDAYDRLKGLTMKPTINIKNIRQYLNSLVETQKITRSDYRTIYGMITAALDDKHFANKIYSGNTEISRESISSLIKRNIDTPRRKHLLGNAIKDGETLMNSSLEQISLLERYHN